ncbi:MAG: hypothetical protein GY778_27270 [bacterium]|nr:hypothetical protein [bacterium]
MQLRHRLVAAAALAAVGLATPAGAQPFVEPITGFATDRDNNPLDSQCASLDDLAVVLLQDPAEAGVTAANILADFGACDAPGGIIPSTEESFVARFGGFEDADGVNAGHFMNIRFQWVDETDLNRWVLVETLQSPTWGDPSVHLGAGAKVRIAVNHPDCSAFNHGDLIRHGRIGVALLIRETGNAFPQGFQDTSAGRLEFVGVDSVDQTVPDSPIPVPTLFIDVTDTGANTCNGSDPGDWIELEFDLASGDVSVDGGAAADGQVIGWTNEGGDGTLDATDIGDFDNRGVLAGLVLVVDAAGGDITSEYLEFRVDNIEFESPVIDPTIAPRLGTPIIDGQGIIRVNDVLSSATDVQLEIDRNSDGDPNTFTVDDTCNVAPAGALFVDVDLNAGGVCTTGGAVAVGDQVRANQTNPSGTSGYSIVITVNPPAAFSFTLSLDEDGNCGVAPADFEWVGASSVIGTSGTQGKPVFAVDGVWQTVSFSLLPGVEPVIDFAGGNGQLQPDGGNYNIDAIFLTIDPSDPQTGPYDIFIDHITYTDASDNEVLISDAEFANPFPGFRGQSTSTGNSSTLSTLASFDGVSSNRIQWEFPDTALSNTCAPFRPCVPFADTAKAVSFKVMVGTPPGPLQRPDVVAPIIGDAPFVTVSDLDLGAMTVILLVNGADAGSTAGGTASVDIAPTVTLNLGDSVSAKYVMPDTSESPLAFPHGVSGPPAPAVQDPLVAGQTKVTVSSILNAANAAASAVTLKIDGAPLAPVDPAGATVVVIDVGVSLTAGQQVTANQTVNGVTSPDSAPVGVGVGDTACMVINEFSYDDSDTDDREYVELYNADAGPVDISGWTLRASDEIAPPSDDNPDYVIPATPPLAPGDFYVIGNCTTVANCDLDVGTTDLWENGFPAADAIELLDGNGVVVDTAIYELNKGFVAVSPAEGGVFGNFTSVDGQEMSWSRWLDGYDTADNGRDFGLRPSTPGATNSTGSLAPLADNFDGGAVGTSVPTWLGSFVDLIYIDPTVADTNNTNAIPVSPGSGSLAAIAWDPAGGGNTVELNDEARYAVSFTCLVYIDSSSNGFTAGSTSGEFEQWDIGLGTASTFYNTGLGDTGLTWKYRRTEDLDTGTLASVVLDLVDENDGGADETVLFSVPGGSLTTGWHTLTLTRNYENYSGAFDADATAGVLAGNGPSAMFIGYQEALFTNSLGRPPTIDDLSVTVPAAPTLGACCSECGCQLLTAAECTAIGGFYPGDGSDCSDADTNGQADICEAFVPPAPTVAGTLCDGGMAVTVTGIVIESSEVSAFEGANPIGSAPTLGASTVAVFVTPALTDGDSITAVQTAGGIDSPASSAVVVTTCPAPPDTVVINEVSYDDSDTNDREFVELYNTGVSPVDIGGWALRASDTAAPPGDNNPDYGIPAGTVLAAGDYYVLGSALVPELDQEVGATDLWEDDNEAIELIHNTGGVVDTVIYELHLGTVGVSPAEGGIFPRFRSIDGTETSLARYLDGVDTGNNGRDFGLRPWTPGTDNLGTGSVVTSFPVADVDGLAVGDPHPGMTGSFLGGLVIDPAVGTNGAPNPNAIPASPQGGLCTVGWDTAGGGNAVVSNDVAAGSSGFDMYVYIDTAFYGIGGAESTSYGLQGTTGTFYRFPDPSGLLFGGSPRINGNTGVGWLYEKEDSAALNSVKLYDAGDGGNSAPGGEWVVHADIPMAAEPSGWHRISIDYDQATGNVVAKFDDQTFNFATDTDLIGGVYIGYRESLQGSLFKRRPPTFDMVEGAAPAATGWQSCALHDPSGAEGSPTIWCMGIEEVLPPDPCDPRTDTRIEPRFFGVGGTAQAFHEIVIDLDGAAAGAVTVDAVCTPPGGAHSATVTVSTDGLTVTAKFDPSLPNTECCTITLGGGATGSQVIKILQGDVNGSGRVNATDKNVIKGKITSRTPPLTCDDFFYDVNMSGRINATDKNFVKGKITAAPDLDATCP